MSGGILNPNQVKIEAEFCQGPNAFPSASALPTPNGVKVIIFGGLSKLEYIVTRMVAEQGMSIEDAVEVAKRILSIDETQS